jgi:diguanylate cyclase (GGDEF)-like protein/PAS domain S-box-containing protein
VIIALLEESQRYDDLLEQLQSHQLQVTVFTSIVKLSHWIETNPEPSGAIVDFKTSKYQDFLIRFSLRYPEIPVFTLSNQSKQQLALRLRSFTNRLKHSDVGQAIGKILLVDDSKTVRMQYKKLLEKDGFVVEVAQDAEEGFDMALSSQYSLAIIDYFMPGETGAQLVAKLQAHDDTYQLVCAILTAQYKQSVVDECLKVGARECMFKNESSDLFITRVRALLRGVERKRQVEKERSRLIGILYSVAEGVFGVSQDGRIQFVNPATLKLLGRSLDGLMGRFPHECIHPTDNRGQLTSFEHCFLQQAYLFGDELRDWRTLFQRSDGSLFPVECSVTILGNKQSVLGSVVVFRDISEQERLEKNWQWQLNHDQLTGLLNRNAFEEILTREVSRNRRSDKSALLFFIDLDKFKLINDELGHAAGDQLLISLADSLQSRARETDFVGRLSGDEFVVILTELLPSQFEELAESYRRLLENTSLYWEDKVHTITGSIGVTLLDSKAGSIGELLIQADLACQQAKLKGRNQWAFFSEEDSDVIQQGNWFKRLNDAMKEQQFSLLQQPIYSTNNIESQQGSNCLLRLVEGSNLISPAIFMSDAKRFGVIKDIDRLVLQKLASYCQESENSNSGWFSLCLSIDAMSDQEFRASIAKIWQQSGLAPDRLRFEIAEEELFKFPQWKNHLNTLRELGFGIVISHFGLNTQSVLNLPQMPIDAIKLDTSLTRDLTSKGARRNLIDAIVNTATQVGIEVIATHIETTKDLENLVECRVDQVQGFYLGKPAHLL